MFGLSWEQIILILLAALFLLGPERIPVATRWLIDSLRKLRTMAAGAQAQMQSQLGPEIEELRRQVAELQSLKEVGELRALRELDPRRMVGKGLLGDQFSGGVTGFLGLNDPPARSGDSAGGEGGTGGTGAGGGAATDERPAAAAPATAAAAPAATAAAPAASIPATATAAPAASVPAAAASATTGSSAGEAASGAPTGSDAASVWVNDDAT